MQGVSRHNHITDVHAEIRRNLEQALPCPRHGLNHPSICWHNATTDELHAFEKAMVVSGGNLDLCKALLRGEAVPVERLDPDGFGRYGRRP